MSNHFIALAVILLSHDNNHPTYIEQQNRENDDHNDFLQQWDDHDANNEYDDTVEYFDDCGLEFVPPGDDSIDNTDLTRNEEVLFIATYKHGVLM
jgi:hypothetical protein